MAKRLFYALLWAAAAFSLAPAPASGFTAGPCLPFVTSSSAVRMIGKYGPPTKAERIWASPSDFDSVGPSMDDEGHSPPSARDPKTFYASKLDAIQDEITKKEAESWEISAKLRDAESALKFEKSYLGITDMEKLSHVVEGLKKDAGYNSNEIYWLRDTERILLGRYQGLSSADFISKHLLEFAQGLTNATRTGNLLQLPDGVFFLGNPSLGSKMFVRPCYSELADLIVKMFENGMRRMILISTPGIGKSMFTLFLLYCLRLDGKTVVLDWKNRWYRFSDDKGVERGRYGTFQSAGYLDEENGWFLSYPSSRPNQNFLGAAVVMASPNVKETYYDVWKYLGANEIFMPPWTLSELEQCREVLFPHVPKEIVRESYNTVGGLPQTAFNRTVMLHLKSEIERRAAKVTSQDLKCLREIARRADTWEWDSNVLYHICLRGGEYKWPTLCLASEYARSLVGEDPKFVANAE